MPHSGLSLALAFGFVLASSLVPGRASACSPIASTPHFIDPALQAIDMMAPNLAPLGEVSVHRGRASLAGEVVCFQDVGRISIGVQATDDMSPAEQIGYLLSVVSGRPPEGLILPTPILAVGQSVSLQWQDGPTTDQEPFDMTLSVVALDRAGNQSAPQTVRVQDPGGGNLPNPCAPLPGVSPYQIDPALAATDQTAPDLPPLVAEVTRGHARPAGACGSNAVGTCDNVGWITVTNLATDDQTPAFFIGYRFAVVEGRLPQSLNLPAQTLSVPIREGRFALQWNDGAVEDQEPIDVTLQIVAVDQAGNESTPQMLRITDPGVGGGCRVAGRSTPGVPTIAVVVLALGIAVSRRRRPRGS